ncbi:hypothetical protein GCM10007036_20690 [Alsobacter metallidurans]|uniref:Uncharacterized protein n=1 Tax=Alsobacter metallidurans TaxID=340221 RepID=A0A917I831_9HYPH|nr:hypothetical protein [Alsobacter metallidurans]GGH18468.1 hypothetical protein GCM10007036_20690 [Alsobacter metallidurans]
MRFTAPVLALALCGFIAAPAAAQQLGAPLSATPATQKPAKPAAKAAKPTAKAQAAAQTAGRQPKWEDAPMPTPLPEKDPNPSWPTGKGGMRPTMGSGGGGMALGF